MVLDVLALMTSLIIIRVAALPRVLFTVETFYVFMASCAHKRRNL